MDKIIFDRILNIIKKTGDRVVIINPDSNSSYVVMSLEDYEKMAGIAINLTRKEPTDKIEKINRDIALWREEEIKKAGGSPGSEDEDNKIDESESQFYFEPVE